MASMIAKPSSFTYTTLWELGGTRQAPNFIRPENGLRSQFNGKLCKTVVSGLALPPAELAWISVNGSTAHVKGGLSSIKKIKLLHLSRI